MNIEQVKKNLENGIIVSPITYRKLVEAALLMKGFVEEMSYYDKDNINDDALKLLLEVEAL